MALRMTFDGEERNAVQATNPFTYYIDTSLNVSWLHPLGGPISGGTVVHVYLVDSRLLVDLGGELYGPACRFSYSEPSPARERLIARSILVRANLTSCNGQRYCGAGWSAMLCVAPPYTGPLNAAGAADVAVEVTINGQDYTTSGRSFRYYDPSSWRAESFAPLGGPLTGNTSMRIVSRLFQSLGDVRCRFGDHPLTTPTNATILSASEVACASPPHWEVREGRQHVEVQLTLNGQDYISFGPQARLFTYYALDQPEYGLSVDRLTPNGGPNVGGTLVTVRGTGFADLELGGGGLLCRFSGEASVTATHLVRQHDVIRCNAPPIAVLASPAAEPRTVEVTLNRQLRALSASAASFLYFNASAFDVSWSYPLGGPISGGTVVHVYLVDSRLLVDLGGELYGPACRFSYSEPSPARERLIARSILVRANLTSCNGQRYCGAGWSAMLCVAPPYTGPLNAAGAADVAVEVTINGQDYTTSGRSFRYYDPSSWRAESFAPLGGPLTGNTSMRIVSRLFQSLGDVRCRFGDHPLTTPTNATILSASEVACASPPHWEVREGRQHVEVQLTLNGQDYISFGPQARLFTYYALDQPEYGLSVDRLTPNGGPNVGGTLVTVRGTGFADFGGLWCTFGLGDGASVVPASLIDTTLLKCSSPTMPNATAFSTHQVEVTVNGQLHARTAAGSLSFTYFGSEDVRISRVYPQGGPAVGGTLVTVYGTGFRDLKHGTGLFCAFGSTPPLMPATASGANLLTCLSPSRPIGVSAPAEACPAGASSPLPIRLTLNANNSANANVNAFSMGEAPQNKFHYHEAANVGS